MAKKAATPTAFPSDPAADRDWQAEDDHRTLMRASEIEADPARVRGVRKHNRKQLKHLGQLNRRLDTRKLGGR